MTNILRLNQLNPNPLLSNGKSIFSRIETNRIVELIPVCVIHSQRIIMRLRSEAQNGFGWKIKRTIMSLEWTFLQFHAKSMRRTPVHGQ